MRASFTRRKKREASRKLVERYPASIAFLNDLTSQGASSSRGTSFCILRVVYRIRSRYVVNLQKMFEVPSCFGWQTKATLFRASGGARGKSSKMADT